MKRKLTKVAWEALSAELQKLYKPVGDDYVLQLEDDGSEDAPELRRANIRLKAEKEAAEKLQKETQEALDAINTDTKRKAGDIKSIEADWENKLNKEKAEHKKTSEKFTAFLVESTAKAVAAEISTMPALLQPVLAKRLKIEMDGDKPIVRVLDANGNASASSIKDLQQEFLDNKEYSGILIASRANGGASGKGGSGSGGSGTGATTLEEFGKMTDAKRTELYKNNPDEFKRLSNEQALAARKF